MGLAADRGVTICFADLDGADGLWVPEERTILVSRRLSERRVNEVIEHELAHVAIDDQHAALDAGVWQPRSRLSGLMAKRWAAPALSAAAFVALVSGVTLGLSAAAPDDSRRETKDPLPVPSEFVAPPVGSPTTTRVPYIDSDGNTRYHTVTLTPSVPASPSLTASGGRSSSDSPLSTRVPGATSTAVDIGGTTPTPKETPTPEETTPTPEPTTSEPPEEPPPTSDAPAADPTAIGAGG